MQGNDDVEEEELGPDVSYMNCESRYETPMSTLERGRCGRMDGDLSAGVCWH